MRCCRRAAERAHRRWDARRCGGTPAWRHASNRVRRPGPPQVGAERIRMPRRLARDATAVLSGSRQILRRDCSHSARTRQIHGICRDSLAAGRYAPLQSARILAPERNESTMTRTRSTLSALLALALAAGTMFAAAAPASAHPDSRTSTATHVTRAGLDPSLVEGRGAELGFHEQEAENVAH